MAGSREIKITILGDDKSGSAALKTLATTAGTTEVKVAGLGKSLGVLGTASAVALGNLATQGVQVLGGAVRGLVDDAQESARVAAQLTAVLTSTGGAAGMTADDVDDLSTSLSALTGIDDEAITSAQSVLLTFTNIGKEVFPDTTQAVLDLSVALGQDFQSSAIQVGKALNDPIAGITALTRVGVTFTDQQKDQIAAMVEVGNVAGAQKIILAELAKEFGGSAEAQATNVAKLTVAWGNLRETLGGAILPVIEQVAGALNTMLRSDTAQTALAGLTSGIQSLVDQAIPAFDRLIVKVSDPAFQQQAREWGIALKDVAIKVKDTAEAVGTVLSPVLTVAADLFGNLDQHGKDDAIMFGLVALAAWKFHGAITEVVTVVRTMPALFDAATAAAARLDVALGGPVIAVIAELAIVLGGAALAWKLIIDGMVKYRDLTGGTTKMNQEFNQTMDATAFALAHGAQAGGDAHVAFLRLVDSTGKAITSTEQLARYWNQYIDSLPPGVAAQEGLQRVLLQSAPAADQAANGLRGLNNGLGDVGTSAPPAAAAIERVAVAAQGLATGASAAGVPVAGIGTGMAGAAAAIGAAMPSVLDLGRGFHEVALGADAAASATDRATIAYNNHLAAISGLNSKQSELRALLAPLQAEWDALNIATDNGKKVTDDQRAAYQRLAPSIEYLNGQLGVVKSQTVDATIAAVDQKKALDDTTAAAALEGIAQTGAGVAATLAAAVKSSAAATTKKAVDDETNAVGLLKGAIEAVPTSFTVTAHVDISGAISSLEYLDSLLPHSPAKIGPFSTLPNWGALFDLTPALRTAEAKVVDFAAFTTAVLPSFGSGGWFGANPIGSKPSVSRDIARVLGSGLAAGPSFSLPGDPRFGAFVGANPVGNRPNGFGDFFGTNPATGATGFGTFFNPHAFANPFATPASAPASTSAAGGGSGGSMAGVESRLDTIIALIKQYTTSATQSGGAAGNAAGLLAIAEGVAGMILGAAAGAGDNRVSGPRYT